MPINLDEYVEATGKRKILLRRFVTGLLLLAVVCAVFVLTGRILLHLTVEQITEMTGAAFDFDSIDYNLNGSVIIRKLVIRPYQKQGPGDTILEADTVYVRFGLVSLLRLRPRLKNISISDFTFNARYDSDARRWNISGLKIKLPKGGAGKMPFIHLERGVFKYSRFSNGQTITVMAVPVYATVVPTMGQQGNYSFNITTARKPSVGRNALSGLWQPPGRFTITGGFSSTEIPLFERNWTINALDAELNYNRTGVFSLKLKLKNLLGKEIPQGDAFARQKPVFLGGSGFFNRAERFFSRYRPSGKADIDIEAFGNFDRPNETSLRGKVYCRDVSICDRRFPYTVEHLTGWIDLTEQSASLNNLSGRHGEVAVTINGFTKGFGPLRQYDIQITSGNMTLDGDLYNALSTGYKKSWSNFSPAGLAAIDYRISRQSQTDKKTMLAVKLLDVEAAYQQFPYPLKNLTGGLLFARDSVTISDVVSQYDRRKITLNGTVTDCGTDRPICDISIAAENIPLDLTLAAALPEKQKQFYDKLDMAGIADGDVKIFTPHQNLDATTFTADVSFRNTSLKVPVLQQKEPIGPVEVIQSPLLISDISAKAILTPELIRIEDLKGQYGRGPVSLRGQIQPGTDDEPPAYCLQLNAEQAELNEDLISVLPPGAAKIISEMQPAGEINLTANLNSAGAKDCPDYEVIVDCLGNSINFVPFSYPLKDIIGRLTITENSFTLTDIAASLAYDMPSMPNTPSIKMNGRIVRGEGTPSGDWFQPSAGDIIIAADGLKIKGKSLTNLRTGLYYVPEHQSWQTKELVANCYGGRLVGKLEIKQPPQDSLQQADYILQFGFEDVDLKRFLDDPKQEESSHTSGKMNGSISITGRLGEKLPNIGRCRLQITDMQVGKLSPLAKLLQVLKLTEPGDYAFQQMLVDSYIRGSRLSIEKFDLSGEAIAFNGTGGIDLQSQDVNLTLTARGRRLATAEPSVLQSLTDALATGVVRMEVTGNVYDPQVEVKTLPVIKDSLRILGDPH